jgi:microcystin-dependent protein
MHTLTELEMPMHRHNLKVNYGGAIGGNMAWGTNATGTSIIATYLDDVQIADGSLAHNNMPPYLVVYIWKRIQ